MSNMKAKDKYHYYKNIEHYQNELGEPSEGDLGNLTVAIMKARFYATYPDGFEFTADNSYGMDRLYNQKFDFEAAMEAESGTIVEAVHDEWVEMPYDNFHHAQRAILAAIARKDWTEEDWDEYRREQKIRQEKGLAAKTRIKLEAAERTAKLAKEASNP
jgi:hypothetical protein